MLSIFRYPKPLFVAMKNERRDVQDYTAEVLAGIARKNTGRAPVEWEENRKNLLKTKKGRA